MQSLEWYYHRLRRMGAREILWRVQGVARECLDLLRFPLRLYPHVRPAGDWSSLQPGFTFRPHANSLPDANRRRLIAKAESVLANRLSFFQHVDLDLGREIDWHRDWNQGIASPRAPCPLVDYRVAQVSGDCKEVWEPNRHHQVVVLARAFHETGDPRYAEAAFRLMTNWLSANPFGHGMNWKNPLELGVRVINWIWALNLLRGAACSAADWRRIHEALYLHVWDLARKFSRGSSANNHLVGEAAGVYVATAWLPSLPHARDLREQARRILVEEIDKQFHTDGGTREQALGYQFFSIQFFTLCWLIAEQIGESMSAGYGECLRAAYDYLGAFGEGGSELPFYGDKDDGYVLDLGDGSHDVDALVALAGVLFDHRQEAASEAAFWLCDVPVGRPGPPAAQDLSSRAFAESGHYLLQCGSDASRISVHVDCAPLGYGSIAAHGHADALSFTLRMGGLSMLVDPGTYDYFTEPAWRDAFRHTRAHNTVCVDDINQSELLGPFLWGRQAASICRVWTDDEAVTFFRGAHDGYTSLPDPVTVERSFCLDKTRRSLQIEDDLEAASSHTCTASFHFHPACAVSVVGRLVTAEREGQTLRLKLPEGVEVAVYRGDPASKLGWFSAGYHHKTPATSIVLTKQFTGRLKLRYSLSLSASKAQEEAAPNLLNRRA